MTWLRLLGTLPALGTFSGRVLNVVTTTARRRLLADHLPGRYRETPFGRCFVAEWRFPVGHQHGLVKLDGSGGGTSLGRLVRDGEFGGLDDALFLDVETTGLAGGTGTYVFLVGLAYLRGGQAYVEQFFLDDLPEERAFLVSLSERLGDFRRLVTFNGKSFDLPLLQTRFVLARERFRWDDVPHLDLLFTARRLWRHRLESCRLERLEEAIVGFHRRGDIPGWLIPSIFFSYLRVRDPANLVPVFRHNLNDLLSLVALTLTVDDLLTTPRPVCPAADLYGLGRLWRDLDEHDRAIVCFERALVEGLAKPHATEAARLLATTYRQLQRREDAIAIWQRLAAEPGSLATFAFVELAKHSEHQMRELEAARDWTLQALAGRPGRPAP